MSRFYMRREYSHSNAGALKWLLVINVAAFFLTALANNWFGSNIIEKIFALSTYGLASGYVWTIITYSFLHGDFGHILFNMLLIFFVGRIVEPLLGVKRFLQLYFTSVLLGGLCWFLLNLGDRELLVGASAGGAGLLTFFCFAKWEERMMFLLFFIIPIVMKPKWLFLIFLGVELFLFAFYEVPGRTVVASSAHLGGILGGFIMYQVFMRDFSLFSFSGIKIERPKWLKGKVVKRKGYKVNITNKGHTKAEVDRILDKINNKGFGSLTQQEKEYLDQAKDILND